MTTLNSPPEAVRRRIDAALLAGTKWLGLEALGLAELVVPDPRALRSFHALDLSDNHLSRLPDWLGTLTELRFLNLSGNRFTVLPTCLRGMRSLESLAICDNQLTALPEWLASSPSLVKLDLSGNRFSEVPQWVGDMALVRPDADAGPGLAGPPPDVVGRGSKAVLEFLRRADGPGPDPNPRVAVGSGLSTVALPAPRRPVKHLSETQNADSDPAGRRGTAAPLHKMEDPDGLPNRRGRFVALAAVATVLVAGGTAFATGLAHITPSTSSSGTDSAPNVPTDPLGTASGATPSGSSALAALAATGTPIAPSTGVPTPTPVSTAGTVSATARPSAAASATHAPAKPPSSSPVQVPLVPSAPSAAITVTAPAPPPAPVTTFGVVQGWGGFCLDDDGNQTTNGNRIQIFACNGTMAQYWTFNGADSTMRVLSKCMSVSGNGTASGTLIVLEPCDQATGESWIHRADGTFYNPHSGRCLTDPYASAAQQDPVVIADCSAALSQQWTGPS